MSFSILIEVQLLINANPKRANWKNCKEIKDYIFIYCALFFSYTVTLLIGMRVEGPFLYLKPVPLFLIKSLLNLKLGMVLLAIRMGQNVLREVRGHCTQKSNISYATKKQNATPWKIYSHQMFVHCPESLYVR